MISLASLKDLSPKSSKHHLEQMAVFGTVSLFSSFITSLFIKSNPPLNALSWTLTSYIINTLSQRLFVEFFEPYRHFSLVPTAGQLAHLSFTFITANIICSVVGLSIHFRSIPYEIIKYILILLVAAIALNHFSKPTR